MNLPTPPESREGCLCANIIDILKKGNHELFHSAMIAWLLDPGAEHKLGDAFLHGFADRVPANAKGHHDFKDLVDRHEFPGISTESSERNNRYDIELKFGNHRVIIENKTKTIGAASQLHRYEGEGKIIVALGFCDMSFSEEEVEKQYPLIKYRDVLEVLETLPPPEDDFGVLVRHYTDYLKRELGVLKMLDRWAQNTLDDHEQLCHEIKSERYSENDRRYFHLYLLESFRRSRLCRGRWLGSQWTCNKNQRSGVWLANFGREGIRMPKSFDLDQQIQDLRAPFWFHIEIQPNGLTHAINPDCGNIQLRAGVREGVDAREIVSRFHGLQLEHEDSRFMKKPSKKAKSFGLIREDLPTGAFIFDTLEKRLRSFMERYGSFQDA